MFTAVVVGIKYVDDKFYKNDYYAKVGGVTLSEMNTMEKNFVFHLNFKLYIECEMFFKYREQLLSSKGK